MLGGGAEAAGLARHGVRGRGDRFGVAIVILLRLDVGSDVLGQNQPHLVSQLADRPPPMVCTRAGLHGDKAVRQACEERQHLVAS